MPIGVEDCLAGRDLSEPRLSPDGKKIGYVRSDEDGSRVVMRTLDVDSVESSSPWTVRAARSLGGGCFDWMPDGEHLIAVTGVGDIRLWSLEGGERLLVGIMGEERLSSPVANIDGTRIGYVVDQAEIHELDLTTMKTRRVDSGDHAFVFDPTWWNDRLVWQAWSPPHMPWDESSLVGEAGTIRASNGVQHQQPGTSKDGASIGWLDDESGWLNLHIEGFGRVSEAFEHGGPTWGERQRSWCFDETGTRVAFVRNESGFGRLCTMDLSNGRVEERAKAVHGQLTWRGDRLAAIRSGGVTPTQIVVYDTSNKEWQRRVIEIGPTFDWSNSGILVEPESIEVQSTGRGPSGNGTRSHGEPTILHARLYRSAKSRNRLLCWIHGGPTDQWQVVFMPRLAYWLDRGYDVLVPDFRGSTGHGRAYTRALCGAWGIVDVSDVADILDDVMGRLGCAKDAVGILGSSAGGLTALCTAAQYPDLAGAVAVAYPVSDIAALDDGTHRFEAHYNRSLIGSPDETRRSSAERSPIAVVEHLACVPVLVFHGSDDPVVPIEQSRRLVAGLRDVGNSVELVVFEGEGHGFRNPENKAREFTITEEFLERYLKSSGTS